MDIHFPTFVGGATVEGYVTATGYKTPTGVGNFYLKDDGTVGNPSISETDTLQTVSDRGNSTTQYLRSTNYIQAYTSGTYFSSLYPGFLTMYTSLTRWLQMNAGTSRIECKGGTSTTAYIQFPAASGTWVWTLPQKTGTFAMLSDITGGASTLPDLTDVSTAAQTSGFVLASSGGNYAGRALLLSDIPAISISDLSDIPAEPTGGANEYYLKYNDTGDVFTWENISTLGGATPTLQAVVDTGATSTTTITMNSGAEIEMWSGVGTGAKLDINTSLFNMLDSAGTTYTQRTNAKFACTIPGGANSQLIATYLQFQESTAGGSSTYTIYPPSSPAANYTATFPSKTGTVAFLDDVSGMVYDVTTSTTYSFPFGIRNTVLNRPAYIGYQDTTNQWFSGMDDNEYNIGRYDSIGSGSATNYLAVDANGDMTLGHGDSIAQDHVNTSDRRLKESIVDYQPKKIDVRWRKYKLKESGKIQIGVIADELEVNHPEFIKKGKTKEDMDSVRYMRLLIAKVAELEARLEKFE